MPGTEHAWRGDNTIASKPIFSPPPFPSAENVLLQQMESFLHLPPPLLPRKQRVLSYLCLLQRRGLSRTRVGLHVQALPIYLCVVCCIGTGGLYIVELPARPLRA